MSNSPIIETLSNGFRIVIDPMPHVETASVGVWIDAGTRHEKIFEHGIAHLLEHMAFKGTRNRTAKQIVEAIENVGGEINAATSYSETSYNAWVLKDDVTLAAEIIGDILREPLFAEADLKKEQSVICQEIAEAKDQPDDHLFDLVQERAFAGSMLGRSILGSEGSVKSQTSEDLRRFITAHYRPGKMIFGAAGAVDPDKIYLIAKNMFGDMEAIEAPSPEAADYIGGDAVDARDIDQLHYSLGFKGYGWHDADVQASRLLVEIVGGGQASRLFQKLREERGLAYSVYGFADMYADGGLIGFYAGTEGDKAREVETIILQELHDLAVHGPTPQELLRAKAQFRSSLVATLEDPTSRLERAVDHQFLYGKFLSAEESRLQIAKVLPADIARVATSLLASHPTRCAVGPEGFVLPARQM